MAKARERSGAAGLPENADLWELPKRELVELALRLAAMTCESGDESLIDGAARAAVLAERDALKANGII